MHDMIASGEEKLATQLSSYPNARMPSLLLSPFEEFRPREIFSLKRNRDTYEEHAPPQASSPWLDTYCYRDRPSPGAKDLKRGLRRFLSDLRFLLKRRSASA